MDGLDNGLWVVCNIVYTARHLHTVTVYISSTRKTE